jgi:tRNA pseudouridine55 synthase
MSEIEKNEPCGVLVINKHKGVTSHDIVNKIRRLYGTRRVGHTGTLDPLATGVLVVLVGRAAKASEYLVCDSKKYRALLRLGLVSDSEDITGNILSQSNDIPCFESVEKACAEFVGNIKQVPPMYSALKVGGKKLVDLARAGQTVERQARDITVFSMEVSPTDTASDFVLDVHCSSGTYIRTLCADIGARLGCGGLMAELERTEAGGFNISGSYSIEQIESMSEEERAAILIPTESLFESLKSVRLEEFYEKLSRNGCEIYQKKIKTDFAVGERVRMLTKGGDFYAIGEVREYENGTAVKAIKLFDL